MYSLINCVSFYQLTYQSKQSNKIDAVFTVILTQEKNFVLHFQN